MSQVEKGEHKRSYVYERCDVSLVLYRCCCTARRVLLKFRGNMGWNRPACAEDGTHTYHMRTHAHTEAPFEPCHKKKLAPSV